MKPQLARLAFLAFAFLTSLANAQTTLIGTVTNSATGQNLEGARVMLKGTSRETVTDNQGVYRFDDVPAGAAVLQVSYTGLQPAEVAVQVAASGPPRRTDVGLTSDIYRMSSFVVAGEREGQAQAITLQRNSDGIKSIVAADVFGGLAGNPAELVARLPGIEGESVGGDIRYIRIRGLNHNLSSITMDGNRLADAASAGVTREFQFQTIGSDSVERIEVTKLPTPDLDGDSIGGNVNLVSKSAFDSSPERRIRASIGTIWRATDSRDKIRPNYSLSYSEVFRGRIGVSFSAAYRPHYVLADQTTQQHQQLPSGPLVGPAFTHNFAFVDFRNLRKRSGVSLKVDFKLSDTTRFFVTTSYNKHVEHESDTEGNFVTNQNIAAGTPPNFTGNNGIIPGFTDAVTQVRPVPASVVTLRSTNLYKDGRTQNIQIGGVHRYPRLHLDYDGYQSASKANYAGTAEPDFIARGTMGWRLDRSENAFLPTLTQTAGPDWTNINSYTGNALNVARRAGWDNYQGLALNAKQSFTAPVPFYVKAGVRWREQTRRNVSTPYSGTYVGPDGVMGVNPATGRNDDNLAQFMSQRPLPGDLARYPRFPFPNVVGEAPSFWEVMQQRPQEMRQNLAADLQAELRANTQFEEDIKAAYIMGDVKLGRLSVLAGVRVEETEVVGHGSLQNVSPEERARRAAWGTAPLTEAETRRRAIAEFGNRQTRTGEYRNVLPGVHLKFTPLPNLVARLGYAANVGRPSIGQLVPNATINDENRTVTTSNPALQPQTADNFDFSMEYYFEPAGVLTAGVFLKEIQDFIYNAGGQTIEPGEDNGFNGQYAGYTINTQANGGTGKVKGLELSYMQQLTFLPGFWKGFGFFANGTWMKAEGNYGSGTSLGATLAPTPKIQGFNPLNANAGISYIRNKLTLRVQLNHRGRYLLTYNANESRQIYARKRTTIGFKSAYRFTRQIEGYFDVVNLLGEPDREYEYNGGRARVYSMLSPQFYFGVNARL